MFGTGSFDRLVRTRTTVFFNVSEGSYCNYSLKIAMPKSGVNLCR